MFLFSKASVLAGLTLLLLTGLVTPAKAQFNQDFIILNGTRYYTLNSADNAVPFDGIQLGPFNGNNNRLELSGEANTIGNEIQSVQLLYRVYRQGDRPSNDVFNAIELSLVPSTSGSELKKWVNTTSNPNLLAGVVDNGPHVLELFFEASAPSSAPGGVEAIYVDNNNGNNHRTTFTINGRNNPTRWDGSEGPDWFNDDNWTPRGAPTAATDVIIQQGSRGQNPVITNNPNGSLRRAFARTLRIVGSGTNNPNNNGATVSLRGGELRVYGNFQDTNRGLIQTGGTFFLSGTNQTFDGAAFTDITIEGGGTKTLTDDMTVSGTLAFTDGILATRTDNVNRLTTTRNRYGVALGPFGRVQNESETSYVLGVIQSTKPVVNNSMTDFGNIGVDLMVRTGNSPGTTLATRISRTYYDGRNGISIRRGFTFTPNALGDVTFDLIFHYLNVELNNISAQNLVLFRSLTGGVPFENLSKTSNDPIFKTVTRNGITGTLAATFTLGNQAAPLPVTIKSFTAETQGADAVLTWATAQEINSKGFEVQVSNDGESFRTLEFVASASPNSSAPRNYRYRDAEAGKQGTRYYRLRQVDLDGKAQFIGPKSLTFGAPTAASVKGYPNPFSSEIKLELQTVAAGQAMVSVLDGVGRQVRSWQPMLQAGASDLQLPGLQSLSRGLYIVEVRYQDGHVQRLKLMKE